MKLYEFAPTRSIRARWTLQELGVAFEAVTVNLIAGEHREPAFLKLNPAGKLPVLVDGPLVLTESVAIVLYLADKYPQKHLIPADPAARAEVERWLLFTVTELEQPLWRIARHSFIYPAERRLPAEIALAREDFQPMAAIMQTHLDGKEFVLGDQVSVADFVLAYTLDWASMGNLLEGFPGLAAYMERMYRRPQAPMRIKAAFETVRGG
jgi:glutathione S-transferase